MNDRKEITELKSLLQKARDIIHDNLCHSEQEKYRTDLSLMDDVLLETSEMGTLTFQQVVFCRNGIAGAPYHIVRFHDSKNGDFVATVFEERGVLAVMHLARLRGDDDRRNKWRSDNYESGLRAAIKEHDELGKHISFGSR